LPDATVTPAVDLHVSLAEICRKALLADVELLCAGKTFLAHKVVLAAQSDVFRQGLSGPDVSPEPSTEQSTPGDAKKRREVPLAMVTHPEAVQFMVDYMYSEGGAALGSKYDPGTAEVNKDVLRLAKNFQLPGLQDIAMRWLARDVDTLNVVDKLAVCEEFGLEILHDEVTSQLVSQPDAFLEVAKSKDIRCHPSLMQALLQRAAKEQAAVLAQEATQAAETAAASTPVVSDDAASVSADNAPATTEQETKTKTSLAGSQNKSGNPRKDDNVNPAPKKKQRKVRDSE